jgi:ribose transport system permease protein
MTTEGRVGGRLRRMQRALTLRSALPQVMQRTALIQAWIVVIVIFSILNPTTFPTNTNFASIFGSQAFVAFLALGLIIVLKVGEFDLSIAAIMTVGSTVFAVFNVEQGMPLLAAVGLTLVIGMAIGLTNGLVVVGLGVDSFIATLGMATVLGGVALGVTDGETIVGVSEGLVSAVTGDRFLGVSLAFYYAVALMLVLTYLYRYTVLGRRLVYVGKSADVARLSGLQVGHLKVAAFVLTGVISAGAGVILAGTKGSADPTSGLAFLLPVYAAAFLGATTTRTGEFTPIGTIVAVYFLATGVQGLAISGVATYGQQIFYGAVLILAVASAKWLMKERRRRTVAVVATGSPASEAAPVGAPAGEKV